MTPATLDADAPLVLIVDDVPDNVAVLHDALDEAGYTVLVALDGESALARAAQALPDLILLDAVAGSAFRRRATSKPSMPGITASSNTTSGWAWVARRIAASPSSATSTV